MTEIPEYLLERSRERRAALGLSTGEEGESAPAESSGEAATPATSEPKAPAPAPTPAAPAPPPEPEPVPPYVEAAESRPKVPVWAAPVLVFLPIWAFFYVGTLETPEPEATGLLAEGEELYASACAGCHGAAGGGGTGPALSDGAVLETFPRLGDHVAWVGLGSDGYGNPGDVYGNPDRPGGARVILGFSGAVMPAFAADLSAEELLAVVLYERVQHGGAPAEVATLADELVETGELELPESFEGLGVDEIITTFEPLVEMAAEEGITEVAAGSS